VAEACRSGLGSSGDVERGARVQHDAGVGDVATGAATAAGNRSATRYARFRVTRR
jgi:hypothetical protein